MEAFEKYSGKNCLKCGSKLVLAYVSDKKADDTVYKIILEGITKHEQNENQCIETIMKIGGFDRNEALEKIDTENSIIFEGNLSDTYINMSLLDDIGIVRYTVSPSIPYSRVICYDICPECGCETIEKMEEIDGLKNYVKQGMFCEHCNDWVIFCSVNKMNMDDTIYTLVFSVDKINGKENEELLTIIENLHDKDVVDDKIVICDKANTIYNILQRIEAIHINYEVDPPFPYEICEFREMDEDFLNEILEFSRTHQIDNRA